MPATRPGPDDRQAGIHAQVPIESLASQHFRNEQTKPCGQPKPRAARSRVGSSVTPARWCERPAGWTRVATGPPARPAGFTQHTSRTLEKAQRGFPGTGGRPRGSSQRAPDTSSHHPHLLPSGWTLRPPAAVGGSGRVVTGLPAAHRHRGGRRGPATPQALSTPRGSEGSPKVLSPTQPPTGEAPTRRWKHAGTAARTGPAPASSPSALRTSVSTGTGCTPRKRVRPPRRLRGPVHPRHRGGSGLRGCGSGRRCTPAAATVPLSRELPGQEQGHAVPQAAPSKADERLRFAPPLLRHLRSPGSSPVPTGTCSGHDSCFNW